MCIAQDRLRSKGPKAVNLPPTAKLSLGSLIATGNRFKTSPTDTLQQPESRQDDDDDCGETLPTVASQDSYTRLMESQGEFKEDDLDLVRLPSFDEFFEVPTGGIIAMPREHHTRENEDSRPKTPTDADLQCMNSVVPTPCLDEEQRDFQSDCPSHAKNCNHALHVEVFKPPPFPSESYRTPTSKHSHSHATISSPPPTPRNNCRSHRIDHFEWPEHLYIPDLD